jgi:hypothetical protein
MVFCFVQNFFSVNTRVRIFIFFCRAKRNFFSPEFNVNIRLYDKNSESDYFFFLHQNQNIFFSNIGNQNIFLEKNHNPPLQVKWSFPYEVDNKDYLTFEVRLNHTGYPDPSSTEGSVIHGAIGSNLTSFILRPVHYSFSSL